MVSSWTFFWLASGESASSASGSNRPGDYVLVGSVKHASCPGASRDSSPVDAGA